MYVYTHTHTYMYIYERMYEVKSLSHVRLFVTPWTVAYQAPHSMDSPSKSTGVGCHFLLQGIFLTRDRTQVSIIPGRRFNL